MGRIGDELDIDLVISTGDNFYEDGLTGVDDKRFEESFSNVYTAKSLQKQWYSGKFIKSIVMPSHLLCLRIVIALW